MYTNASLPTARGFDRHLGFYAGAQDHYTHLFHPYNNATPGAINDFLDELNK